MKLYLYILVAYIVLGLGNVNTARAEEDYEFYKKYGHSNKIWNQAVEAGFVAYEKQDCDGTLTQLQEAIRLQAQDPLVYYKMAVCTELKESPYTALQYYQLALEKLETLQAVHRYQRDIYENYGRALLKADRKKDAVPYLTRAAAVGTPSFSLYYLVGSLYGETGNWPAAIENYKKAITQDSSDIDPKLLSQIYFQVGKSYYDAKDLPQASAHLDRALQLDPQNVPAQNLRGEISTALQQKSMTEMMEGISKTPTVPQGAITGSTPPTSTATTPPSGATPTTPIPGSTGPSNLPPAAAKLPPLNPPTSTPPAGTSTPPAPAPGPTTVPQGAPGPAPAPAPANVPPSQPVPVVTTPAPPQ
jgi:tetratricopeptide (TPR) repeat protein